MSSASCGGESAGTALECDHVWKAASKGCLLVEIVARETTLVLAYLADFDVSALIRTTSTIECCTWYSLAAEGGWAAGASLTGDSAKLATEV